MLEAFTLLIEFFVPGSVFIAALSFLFFSIDPKIKLTWEQYKLSRRYSLVFGSVLIGIAISVGAVIDLAKYALIKDHHNSLVIKMYHDFYQNVDIPIIEKDGFFNPKKILPSDMCRANESEIGVHLPCSKTKMYWDWYQVVHHKVAGAEPWATQSPSRLLTAIHLVLNFSPSLILLFISGLVLFIKQSNGLWGFSTLIISGAMLFFMYIGWAEAEKSYHRNIFVGAQVTLHKLVSEANSKGTVKPMADGSAVPGKNSNTQPEK